MFKHILIVFLVSMVPLIELRGAIPYGVLYGLPLWLTFLVAIMGKCCRCRRSISWPGRCWCGARTSLSSGGSSPSACGRARLPEKS